MSTLTNDELWSLMRDDISIEQLTYLKQIEQAKLQIRDQLKTIQTRKLLDMRRWTGGGSIPYSITQIVGWDMVFYEILSEVLATREHVQRRNKTERRRQSQMHHGSSKRPNYTRQK